jgi:hypothetical protein
MLNFKSIFEVAFNFFGAESHTWRSKHTQFAITLTRQKCKICFPGVFYRTWHATIDMHFQLEDGSFLLNHYT